MNKNYQRRAVYIFLFAILLVGNSCSLDNEDSPDKSLLPESVLSGKIEFFILKSFEKKYNSCLIDESQITLSKEPLLTYSDIVSYNPDTYTFKITKAASLKLINLQTAPVYGVPFALLLNDNVLYTGYFWPPYSSLGCEAITVNPIQAVKESELVMQLGYPGSFADKTPDSRNSSNLIEFLRLDRKLIE